MMFKKVALAISGGVDSAVTGFLLKCKNFQVTGVYMNNWDRVDETGQCQAEKDLEDAKWVCDKLQIPFIDVNFVKDYWSDVFSNLLQNYQIGKTPNSDMLCNKKIKFHKFFHYARHHLKVDAIATGHYARNSFGPYLQHFQSNKNAALLQAKDAWKDQTFFLSNIPQEALRRTMFPLGEYLKEDVKRIAKEANLDLVVNKKESMGICFIGNRDFKVFIEEYLENKPGNFVDLETGRCVGKHNGIHQWTLGQCCRIGGMRHSYYVYRKDINNDIIYVVSGKACSALFSEFMVASDIYWINKEPEQLKSGINVFECDFRFQHQKPLVPCTIFKTASNRLLIRVHVPQRALTSGQFAVFYSKNECLGSAEIVDCGPSYYFLNKQVFSETEATKCLMQVQS